MKVVKRVNPKHSHPKEKIIFISLIVYLYEMMDVPKTYCNNHFMMYVSQIIMLYTLDYISQ